MKIIQTLSTKTREIKWKQLRIHNYTCIHICKKMKLCKRGDINKLDYYFLVFFFRPLAQSRRLYIVLSKIWLHRRLIKVKGVAFPLWRLLTTADTERWISGFACDLCGPSANFLDKLNSPVIPGISCFYGNWVEDVRAGQFIILGDFVGCCLVGRCTCLCGSVPNVWYCISAWNSDIPGHWFASGPWDQCAAIWALPILQNHSPVPLLPESTPVSQLSTECHSWSCVIAASASFYGRRDRGAVPVHRLAFHRCRCMPNMPYSQLFEPLLARQPHLIVWDRSRLLEVHAASRLSG